MADSSVKENRSDKAELPTEPVPLQNGWSFWHDFFQGKGISAKDFEASLKILCTFHFVQEFWGYFNNIPKVAQIPQKSSLHLFVEGAKPLWEDPKNAAGGFWTMRLQKTDSPQVWADLVLAAIGDQFSDYLQQGDAVNGLTISVRMSEDIVQVWNSDASQSSQDKLQRRILQICPQVTKVVRFYKACTQHQSFEGATHSKNKH